MTYPKRTIDLEAGDIVCMYGGRDRITKIESVYPERRYGAAMVWMAPLSYSGGVGSPRPVCFDNKCVQVELPKGYKVIAVPEDYDRRDDWHNPEEWRP